MVWWCDDDDGGGDDGDGDDDDHDDDGNDGDDGDDDNGDDDDDDDDDDNDDHDDHDDHVDHDDHDHDDCKCGATAVPQIVPSYAGKAVPHVQNTWLVGPSAINSSQLSTSICFHWWDLGTSRICAVCLRLRTMPPCKITFWTFHHHSSTANRYQVIYPTQANPAQRPTKIPKDSLYKTPQINKSSRLFIGMFILRNKWIWNRSSKHWKQHLV